MRVVNGEKLSSTYHEEFEHAQSEWSLRIVDDSAC